MYEAVSGVRMQPLGCDLVAAVGWQALPIAIAIAVLRGGFGNGRAPRWISRLTRSVELTAATIIYNVSD